MIDIILTSSPYGKKSINFAITINFSHPQLIECKGRMCRFKKNPDIY